jgi:hypothetical protein
MIRRPSLLLLLLLASTGCQATRLVREGEITRNAILDLYTDQAMDNLVRAKCNLPFIQLAYRNLGVQDLDTLEGTVNDTVGVGKTTTLNALGAITSATRMVSNSLVPGVKSSRSKTLSYAADPVTDKNDIYLYYLAFANDPGLLVETCEKPKCGYHMLRKHNHKYYWVPQDAAPVFLELVLKTSMMRGPEIAPPPFYERKIAKVYAEAKDDKTEVVILELNQSIPSGDADIEFTLEKRRYRHPITRLRADVKIPGPPVMNIAAVPEGQPTFFFRVRIEREKYKFTGADLKDASVNIFSFHYPPEVPRPSLEAQRLQDSVDSINVNLKNLVIPR